MQLEEHRDLRKPRSDIHIALLMPPSIRNIAPVV
jgi:hypothetical protein